MTVPSIGQLRLTHRQASVLKSASTGTSGAQHKLRSLHQPSRGRTVLNSEGQYDTKRDFQIFQETFDAHEVSLGNKLSDDETREVKEILSNSHRLAAMLSSLDGDQTKQEIVRDLATDFGSPEQNAFVDSLILGLNLKPNTPTNP